MINDHPRWNKAALQICHEANDLGNHTIDIQSINERVSGWELDLEKAAYIAVQFHNWMNDSEPKIKDNVNPNSTTDECFEVFWHDKLNRP